MKDINFSHLSMVNPLKSEEPNWEINLEVIYKVIFNMLKIHHQDGRDQMLDHSQVTAPVEKWLKLYLILPMLNLSIITE